MKIRLCHVANSSSSSFVCDVCGRTEAGFDMDLSDAEMRECENGHTICESHIKTELTTVKIAEVIMKRIDRDYTRNIHTKYVAARVEMGDEDWAEMVCEEQDGHVDEIESCDMPAEICPSCLFQSISKDDLIDYLLKKCGMSKGVIESLCQQEFSTYPEFKTYVGN